jgi:hypothetical protein
MLMRALHASRRRQADRELYYYRHLVDRNASGPSRAESSTLVPDHSPPRRSRGKRIATVLAIALLAVVASLHIVGGILIANHAASPAGATITLRGD